MSNNLLIPKTVKTFKTIYGKMFSLENFKLTKPDFTEAVTDLNEFLINGKSPR